MIRFLFGRPGTGKTTRMVEEVRELISKGVSPVYLIVPEQQAYSAERDILSALPPEAGRCFSILSFSRLCDTLADLYGGRAQYTVTSAMKSLLMWENLREFTGMLETYRYSSVTDASLCRKMLAATEELSVNGVTPAMLERAAERLDKSSPLRGKLRDLAMVFAAYNGLLTEVYGENPADRLLRAAEKIDRHGFFKGAHIFVDSFSSFTAQEMEVLRLMARQAEALTVSFDAESRYDPAPQFESVKDTVRRLTRICSDAGREPEDVCLRGSHRTASPELLALEEQLWAFDLTPDKRVLPPEEQRGAVRLLVCPTAYDEAEAMALHVLELRDRGVPFGEIAVVVRDVSAWRGVLDEALERYHIPFFLSERTDVCEKPAARLILTALRCVARQYRSEDVIALCKTGLLGLSLRDIDYFAQYVDTWRLSGKRMTEQGWSMNPDGYTVGTTERGRMVLDAANRVREAVMTPLISLESKLKGAADVTEQCRALFEYLCELDIKARLTEQAETCLSLGQDREAGELVRLWSFLTETLAVIASALRNTDPMGADELMTALSLVFSQTDIGSVPARHDCVTVGSASTLRVDNLRAMLVAGLCEGEFPMGTRSDSLFSERDKEALAGLGIELADRDERLLSEELLYVWRTFTKPSETLILSHSTSTADGQSRSPSVAFSRVRYVLPYVKPVPFSTAMIDRGEEKRYRPNTRDELPSPTVRALLGDEIWLSQSLLQTYARCPYSYYGSHILRLRERAEAKFDNLGAGNFLHHVMEKYLRAALDEHDRLRPMDDEEVTETADAIIRAYMDQLCGDISQNGRLLHLFDRLRQVALVLIDNIQAELRQSAFTVAGLEWDTHGRRPEDPRPMILSLETEDGEDDLIPPLPTRYGDERKAIRLLLGGRVDRVDMYRAADGETVYVRVIDYKSSRHEFTTSSVTEDMNIQLLLYLFTLCSPENRALFADGSGRLPERVLPASAVYISPDESDREGAILPCRTGVVLGDPEILEAANSDGEEVFLPSVKRDRSKAFTGRGLCSAEQLAELETILKDTIRETAAEMYGGRADRTPSEDACRYCPLRTACASSVGG